MEVRPLRHFAAVADTLHFGRAAERLSMTQPPLSQSIMALEREIGAPLFVRTKRSVALTPLGEQWLTHVRRVLDEVNGLPELARRLRDGTAGHLALSFVSTADYSILPLLVRRYASLFPNVEISLTEATSNVQIANLLEGHGHVGLVIRRRTRRFRNSSPICRSSPNRLSRRCRKAGSPMARCRYQRSGSRRSLS